MSIWPAVFGRGVSRCLPSGSVSHAKPPRSESLNPVKSPGALCWWKLCTEIRGEAPEKGALATHYSFERSARSLVRVTISRASSGPSFTWALGIFLNGCRLSASFNEIRELALWKSLIRAFAPLHQSRPDLGCAFQNVWRIGIPCLQTAKSPAFARPLVGSRCSDCLGTSLSQGRHKHATQKYQNVKPGATASDH